MKRKLFLFLTGLFLIFNSCSLVESVKKDNDLNKLITSVKLSSTNLTMHNGDSERLNLTINPSQYQNQVKVEWEYDKTMFSAIPDNYGIVLEAISPGTTYIKAKCNGIVATCMITIDANGREDYSNPYIYSSDNVIQLKPGDSTTISCSLFGGSVSDMEFFRWSVVDSGTASISYARNNCVVTGNRVGSTKIEVTHPDAKYAYTFIVFVFTDKMKEPYITTDFNVLSIDKNKTSRINVSVELKNPLNAAWQQGFHWDYADNESRSIVDLNGNYSSAEIVPKTSGLARLKVTHDNAQYSLEILVRVITVVENVYVNVSPSTILIDGSDKTYTITAEIKNYSGLVDNSKFKWNIPETQEGYGKLEDYFTYIEDDNSLCITGKKNGIFKITVSHELAEYSRSLVIILQNQIGSAVDSSMYITTSQNYVQTQVGAEETQIEVQLVGGDENDQKDFSWWIDKGENNGICKVEYVDGFIKDANARSAGAASSGKICPGKIVITPLSIGTLNICITHPRCLYDCNITVKVYSEYALLKDPITINTENSLIKLINGQSQEVTAELVNAGTGEENKIFWESENTDKVNVSPSTGKTVIFEAGALGSGNAQTYVNADYEGAIAPKKILVLTADSQEELDSMKGIYSDVSYLRVSASTEKEITLSTFGLTTQDNISWETDDSSICIVNPVPESENKKTAKLQGIAMGKCKIKAILKNTEGKVISEVPFEVTVCPEGESADVIEEPKYLTTRINAVVLENPGDTETLNVTGVNLSDSNMQETVWKITDKTEPDTQIGDKIFELYGNGSSATLEALQKGKSVINVENKYSSNSIEINAKCGELYEWTDNYLVYITAEEDVINIVKGDIKTFACGLQNTTDKGTFSFKVTQGSDLIDLTGFTDGRATITAKEAGQAIIEVSNTLAEGGITKEILVNIANSPDELNSFNYLSTSQNVVTVGEGNNIQVSVEIKNATGNVLTGYTWVSDNENVCTVMQSGNIASVFGHKCGSAKLKVTNTICQYPLEIIVNVVDPIAASLDPYIQANNIVTCRVNGESVTVTAELVGGKPSDNSSFSWSVVDEKTAQVYASNETAQIKGLKEGFTQLIISHPKASIQRQVLLIVEPKGNSNCSITVPESIIKMSPTDAGKTITATLVGGNQEDIYDFKWWADSYDRINMNYTGDSCIVEPISAGTVTIHCSHPKAPNQKDIVLYISKYNDFAFEKKNITLETGTDCFINMEVPASGMEYDVSYSSTNSEVCTAFGNISVCTLHPGKPGNCTINATLQTKSGAVQARAELLVVVQQKDLTRPYIAFNGSTIVTMNKGEKRNISAMILGDGIADTSFQGLNWEISNNNGEIARTVTSKTTGPEIQIEAVNSGKTTLTISHNETNPLTVYIVVTGSNEPTVEINYPELKMIIGENTVNLIATVTNDTGEELSWTVFPENQNIIKYNAKGTKCSVVPENPGEVTARLTIPSTGTYKECKITVTEPEKLIFFIYDDETLPEGTRKEIEVKELSLNPGEIKLLHYKSLPEKCEIKENGWYIHDSSFYSYRDKGFVSSLEDPAGTGKVYSYPDNVGTVVISGKITEGNSVLQATDKMMQTASVNITNSFGYYFSVEKTMITTNPEEVNGNEKLMWIDYEIRPAYSKIQVHFLHDGNEDLFKNVSLKEGSYEKYEYSEDIGSNAYIVSSYDSVDPVTGIAKGKLKFKVTGECNTTAVITAYNDVLPEINGQKLEDRHNIQTKNISLKCYYNSHKFVTKITNAVPYQIRSYTAGNPSWKGIKTKYSKYDESTNTVILGDGELLGINVTVREPYSNVHVTKVSFTQTSVEGKTDKYKRGKFISDDAKQKQLVNIQANTGGYNEMDFEIYHEIDYGWLDWINSQTGLIESDNWQFYRFDRSEKGDNEGHSEKLNTTVKENTYVGTIDVEYFSMATKKTQVFKIPVYVEVRNCPCVKEESSVYKNHE